MLNPGRYLLVLLACFAVLFAAAWWFAANYRPWYSGAEYGAYRAKLEMIARCDVGDTVVLGDSRAGIAFSPARLGPDVRNFAFPGMTPVEGYYVAQRIFACPHRPSRVLVAFSPNQLRDLTWFWSRGVQMGAVDGPALAEIAANAKVLGDPQLYKGGFGAEPPPAIKNWTYLHAFPVYDFSSILGTLAGRQDRRAMNEAIYRQVLADRGQGQAPSGSTCPTAVSPEARDARFAPSPLIDRYYRRLLALVSASGARAVIAPLPYSASSMAEQSAAYRSDYEKYLAGVVRGLPQVSASAPYFVAFPDCSFVDEMHMNGQGAASFSDFVRARVMPRFGAGRD